MTENMTSPVLLEWQSLDSLPHTRSKKWYLIGGIIVLIFASYGIYDGSWTTTILALMIGGIYFLMRNTEPRMLDIQISGMGIRVGNDFTPWNMCNDFWIIVGNDHTELHPSSRSSERTTSENSTQQASHDPATPDSAPEQNESSAAPKTNPRIELHIAPQRFLQREIVVFIADIDPAAVREVLLQFLPERAGMGERVLDSVARYLKL